MEPLSSFAIGLATSTVYDLIKSNIELKVKNEIESAFENSLKRWSTNKLIIDQKRTELKQHLENNFNKGDEFYTDNLPQEVIDFLVIFNEELCLKPAAYNFLKEINDSKRYNQLKETLDSLDQKVDLLIATSEKEKEEIKSLLIENSPLFQEWDEQIKIYRSLLEEFKPLTALKLVESLNDRLVENKLESTPILQSKIEFLKALCLEQIQEKRKDSYTSFIRAFELNTKNSIYKEKACVTYYLIKDFPNSKKLSDEILVSDTLNVPANATKILLNVNEFDGEIKLIPSVVKKSVDFKRILYVNLRGRKNIKDLCAIFPELILQNEELKLFEFTYLNFKNNTYVVEIALNTFFREFRIEFIDTDLSNKSELEVIFNILNDFLVSIEGTEIQEYYRKIDFFSIYIKYSLYRKKEEAFKLKQCYDSFTNPIDETISTTLANVLQKDGQDKEAISLLKSIESENQNVLNLMMYCAQKINDVDLIVETANKINENTKQIDSIVLIDFLRIIRLLGYSKKLELFDFDLLQSKSSEVPEYSQFIELYYSLWIDGTNVGHLNKINKIRDVLLEKDQALSTYIQEAYFKNKNHEESANIFQINNDSFKAPLDISYYIDSLNILRSNNQELLKWLEYWRTNVDFDSRFARMEIEKVATISDWVKCEEICENAIKHEKHEDFILYLVISLYHNDNKEKFELNLETITKHDYQKSDVAIQIVHFLFHFKCAEEGLELCYLWAKEKDNKQARTFFFTSFMYTFTDEFFIKFEEVIDGCFVRYTMNDEKTPYTKKIDDDEFSRQLIGHIVNDKIVVKRLYGTEEDVCHIIHICNKYLALNLEIMEETRNAQSGLGMQSFTLKENESIIDTLSSIVPPVDNPEEPYEQYYSEEIKFSQLPFFVAELKNNFIACYHKLVYEKKGVLKVNPNLFPLFGISNDYEFILDFTSLLFLFRLSQDGKLNTTIKFNISRSIMDLIKLYIDDPFNYVQHDNYQIDKDFYSELTEWVNCNCNIITPVKLLDIIGDRKIKREEPLTLYLLNQVAMLQEFSNSVLITDDLFFYQMYPLDQKKLMSTDYYLLYNTLVMNFK